MTRFVLDASIALSWIFADEASPQTEALFERVRDYGAVVPVIWYFEVANVVAHGERKKRLTSAQSTYLLSRLEQLPIDVDDQGRSRAFYETLQIARNDGLTVYDAAYLEVAGRYALPLATKDRELALCAQRYGVALILE
jgi:predicted nucleic acid-binding protein